MRRIHSIVNTLAQRFVASRHLRNGLLAALLMLCVCIAAAVIGNPLQYGLIARYYDNNAWNGSPFMQTRDSEFNLWRMKSTYPKKTEQYSIHWTGVIFIPKAGKYQFSTASDDGSEIMIGNQLVVDNRGLHGFQERSGAISLEKGLYPMTIRYMQGGGAAEFQAYWKRPGKKREPLSRATLFPEKPTPTRLLIGRGLTIIAKSCALLLLIILASGIVIGLIVRQILAPFLKESWVGKALQKIQKFTLYDRRPADDYPEPPPRNPLKLLAAFGGYTLISLLWTYPLIRDFSTKVTGLGGDRYIWLWDMWWMQKALLHLHTNPLYTNYLFYPQGVSLAFHDFAILNSFLSVPLQGIFTPGQIYNLLFLATYILGGFGAFLLARYLTGDALAAFVAGLVFAFWGGRIYYCDHLASASIQWFPYAMLFVIKSLRERSYRNPVLAAMFWAMSALSGWYNAVFISLLIGLFVLYAAWSERKMFFTAGNLLRFGLIGLIFTGIMAPFLAPMIGDIFSGKGYMNYQVLTGESTSPNVLFFPGVNHGFLGKAVQYLYFRAGLPMQWGLSGAAFIGYTVLALCAYAVFRLKQVKYRFWLITAVVFVLFSMGPYLQIFSKAYPSIPLPYRLLQYLPILKIVRLPVRFMVIAMLCCSVVAGYACGDLFRRIRIRKSVFVLLSGLILFEFFRPLYITPIEKTPEFYKELGKDTEPYAILELTKLGIWEHASVRSSLFQITHGKQLFHGHVSRVPFEKYYQAYALYTVFDDLFTQPQEYFDQTDFAFETHQRKILALLSFYKVRYVTLYYDYWHGGFTENLRRLQQVFGEPIGTDGGMRFFKVPAVQETKNVIFPGFGMEPLHFQPNETPIRPVVRNGEVKILNIERQQTGRIRLQVKSAAYPEEKPLEILLNGKIVAALNVGDWTDVNLPPVPLQLAENTITFRIAGTGYDNWKDGVYAPNIDLYLRNLDIE
jgi:hypothetical protein